MNYLVVNYLLFIFEYNQTNNKMKKSILGMGLRIRMEKRELLDLVQWAHRMGQIDATASNINPTDEHLLMNVVEHVEHLADHTYNADPPLDTRLT